MPFSVVVHFEIRWIARWKRRRRWRPMRDGMPSVKQFCNGRPQRELHCLIYRRQFNDDATSRIQTRARSSRLPGRHKSSRRPVRISQHQEQQQSEKEPSGSGWIAAGINYRLCIGRCPCRK